MRMEFRDLKTQYQVLNHRLIRPYRLSHEGRFIMGRQVQELEKTLATTSV